MPGPTPATTAQSLEEDIVTGDFVWDVMLESRVVAIDEESERAGVVMQEDQGMVLIQLEEY